MPSLETFLAEIDKLDATHDHAGMRHVREQIVAEYPEAPAAVEAMYKIGLDLLFRERQLDAAMHKFDEAAKRKHPFWSSAARTSLGLCYYHQRRLQKSLFELRKVGYSETPNVHSVTALAFLEHIYESEGKPEEVKRVRKDRILQLQKLATGHLTTATPPPTELGFYLYHLGLALKDSGDSKGAKDALLRAKALGAKAVGDDLYRNILDALS